MDVICESCGVANRQGTEFCLFCGAYLAWDRSVLVARPTPPIPSAPAPPAATPTYASEPPAAPAPAPDPPPPPVMAAPPVGPPPPMPEPRPTQPAPAAPTITASSPGCPCPSCGRVNDPSLRFCAKCGQVLSAGAAVQSTTGSIPVRNSSWWSKRDRSARLAYRRSLPPLYRWRRLIIAFLVAGLGLGGLVAIGRHPVRWAVDRFYDLRGSTVIIPNVQAAVDPLAASAPGSDPAALTDLTEAAWTMTWAPTSSGNTCGGAPGTGVMVLTLPTATRVRQVDLQAGLLASNADRPLQFRPQSVGITFDGGPCNSFPLTEPAGWQFLTVDSRVPVTTVRIGVDLAYPARADGQPLLSLTEITIRSRP